MQTYGICLDAAMEGGYSPAFVAALAMQLPGDCRWRVAYDPDAVWTLDRCLYAGILNTLAGLVWGMADKKKRGARPKPVGPKWAREGRTLKTVAMSREDLLEALSRPRTGDGEEEPCQEEGRR